MSDTISGTSTGTTASAVKRREKLSRVTIRIAGDSGDGIQITGSQFTNVTAIVGNDLATFPDFPAEIRAPAGTLPGVSGYQIQFSSEDISTPGDQPDVLVAFNPAALKVNLSDLPQNALIIVNTDEFQEADLRKANYNSNPLRDGSLSKFRVVEVPITTLTIRALEEVQLTHKEKERCKNFFALGILCWLYSRPLEPLIKHINQKFAKKPVVADANIRALKSGFHYAETVELFQVSYEVPPAKLQPGKYRNINGNTALAIGLVSAARKANLKLFYGSYPITPASTILEELAQLKHYNVMTFQAEDEIAAVCAAIGASYAGVIGVTGTSGPGLALKGEAINLAVMTELPLVVIDVQRAGPSTGMPTKTEQADLLQALYGRNGESPVIVLAPQTPGDCFYIAYEAVRFALKYMVPVIVLSDGYLANGSEPWLIPNFEELPAIPVKFHTDASNFAPYARDEKTLSRPWAIPGTAGLTHRIGGLEKQNITGNVSYDAKNHDLMVRLRAEKVARAVQDVPDAKVYGNPDADTIVVGWGSTYGHILSAVNAVNENGGKAAGLHVRHLNPLPKNLGAVLKRYKRVIVPEINMGHLAMLIRSKFLVDAIPYNKVSGRPFSVSELVDLIKSSTKRG